MTFRGNDNTSPKVSVIILNWNGKTNTLECLASVGELDNQNDKVILVDNGSTEESMDAIRSWFSQFSMLEIIEASRKSVVEHFKVFPRAYSKLQWFRENRLFRSGRTAQASYQAPHMRNGVLAHSNL